MFDDLIKPKGRYVKAGIYVHNWCANDGCELSPYGKCKTFEASENSLICKFFDEPFCEYKEKP
jgi:hypothetical protein